MGKKTAEKIVLELHGKISAAEVMSVSDDAFAPKARPAVETINAQDEEAVSALMGLGFTKNESMQAVKRAKESGATTTEEIIKKALQSGF